jgi:hypothetical protein
MKKVPSRPVLALLSALTFGTGLAVAQTAPAPAAASIPESDKDQTITLDPFTVTSEHEGYQAVDTLGGGRIRTKLVDTPSSLTVVTKKLMDDLGVTNAGNLLVYTNNTEVAGMGGNFSGVTSRGSGTTGEGPRLASPTTATRARGLAPMDNTRNYFPTDIPWDGYDISRVDITRGPNSFLFGFGSPSGIANVQTNEATFTDKGKLETRYSSFGSTRESLDYNKVLIPSVLALRLDLVNDEQQFEQKPAYNHSKRAYGAVRLDPKLFDSDSTHTKIMVNFEHGDVNSNNPREIPPTDYVTGYLNDPRASATGYNPWTYSQDGNGYSPQYSYYSSHGSLANEFQWSNSPTYFWDAPTGTLQKAGQAGFASPTPEGGSAASYGAASFGLSNIYFVHSQGYAAAAQEANYAYRLTQGDPVIAKDSANSPFPGGYLGTAQYYDKTLTDPTIFDFYHKLIDGDNKREWQHWNAFNINVTETLFHDRLAIQAIADHQDFRSGQENGLDNTVIALDLSSYLLAGSYPTWLPGLAQANPNVGRPALYGGSGNGTKNETKRNNYQVTAAYNLDFERDLGLKGTLARILGHHDITGLFGSYRNQQYQENYKLAGIDQAWNVAHNGSSAPHLADNGFNWTAYLGPSLLGTTGAGADLPNLGFSIAPKVTNVTGFSSVWNKGTSVNPTDPWVVTGPEILNPDGTTTAAGTPATLTQADNPANYVGYTTTVPGLLNSTNNMDQLRTGASLLEQKITSKAIMYQGHFWDDTIIPSFGWRQDKTQQRGDVAVADSTTGLFSDVSRITDPGISTTTTSSSYGVAVHLPKAIKKNLPAGLDDVSLYYFHGDNETPKVRYAIDGSQLPNEKGKTDDYSIQIDALKGHATLRLTYFKTIDTAAPASYGQPLGNGSGWLISSLPSWTLTMAAAGIAAEEIGPANMGDMGQPWNNWIWQWGIDHPAVAEQIAQVLKTDFAAAFPQSYWDKYSTNINIAKVQAGDWMHILNGTDQIWPWNATGTATIHGQYAIIDQNVESKGFELEATIRPVKNWEITFNGSRATAEQTSLGSATSNYLNKMASLWLDSPLGLTAEWGSYTAFGTMKRQFIQGLWGPYLTQVALTGTEQPEWSKYKFNFITNYSFDHGFAKGFNAGGAYRWTGRRIIGYGLHEATIAGTSAWLSDVSQPLWSSADSHFDLWAGYQHKLTAKTDWRIQLNVQNVGEKVHLVTIVKEPDGSAAQSRIANGQQFNLTTSVSF